MEEQKHKCEHKEPTCDSVDTIECVIDEEAEWLCAEHAEEAGYCIGCGYYWCGSSEWDRHPGWCDTCYDQMKSDFGEETVPFG